MNNGPLIRQFTIITGVISSDIKALSNHKLNHFNVHVNPSRLRHRLTTNMLHRVCETALAALHHNIMSIHILYYWNCSVAFTFTDCCFVNKNNHNLECHVPLSDLGRVDDYFPRQRLLVLMCIVWPVLCVAIVNYYNIVDTRSCR